MRLRLYGALLLVTVLSVLGAQDFYDPDIVNTIQLTFTQSNWDQLLDNLHHAGDGRLLGTATINGVTFDSVGVRYKGNSSYSANRVKNPWNIMLDHVISGQKYGPYGTIKLSNGFSDPSLLRETLGYEIGRKYMPSSKANYANLYVNGTLIGVYTSVQDLDDYFGECNFGTGDLTRIKGIGDQPTLWSIWAYLGTNPSSYTSKYELDSGEDMSHFIEFLNVFNNNPTQVETVFNVDRHLWMVAFDWLFVNLDAPVNFGHNYYLYEDTAFRFNSVLWDLNMCFGQFRQLLSGGNLNSTTMQNLDPMTHSSHSSYPILNKILQVPLYKRMYIAHMRTMIEENITNGWLASRGAELQAIVGPSVQADPNYFYTYTNFLNNLNSTINVSGGGPGGGSVIGLTQLMNGRATYLLSSTNFQGTVPTISNLTYYPPIPEPLSTITFNLSTQDATTAYLSWRQSPLEPFVRVQMYDDGAHEDGTAGDGNFAVQIPVGYGTLEYYAYAENSQQGRFLPARAEYEYFNIPISTNTGELLINEIMAKNNSYPDPFNENDDWVEIYNPNDYAVDIADMYLTDSHYSNGVTVWTQIPSGYPEQTTIPAHGYLVVWFDEQPDQGPLHINDKLGGAADAVYLIDSDGSTIIDSYLWTESTGLDVNNVSIGRLPDGGTNWQLFGAGFDLPATPGASNQGLANNAPSITQISYSPNPTTSASPVQISANVTDEEDSISSVSLLWGLQDVSQNVLTMTAQGNTYSASIGPFATDTEIKYQIRGIDSQGANAFSPIYQIIIGYQIPELFINEVMASNTSTIADENSEYEDWIEIYNPNDFDIDLAGYVLVDDHYGDSDFEVIPIPGGDPQNTVISARGYKIIWFDEHLDQGALHINSRLGVSNDGVYLISKDLLTIMDQVTWTSATNLADDVSYGRSPDGASNWVLFGSSYPEPATPGAQNIPVSISDELLPIVKPSLLVYPNPSRGAFQIKAQNTISAYTISIYNLKGQKVRELNALSNKSLIWDGKDEKGSKLSSGIYFIKTDLDKHSLILKICILE